MKPVFLVVVATLLLFSCQNSSQKNPTSGTWSDAQWIAYGILPDNMKVIPGVHGVGDHLGNKAEKRSAVPMFRKSFRVTGKIKNASIYISGLGHYELYLNGQKVGDRFLAPGWTDYRKRILYNSYDLSSLLKQGENAIGVLVGNGFYNINRERYRKLVIAFGYPKLIFRLRVDYQNGEVMNVISDETCKVSSSPITFSSIYGGEDYDATLEQKGWNDNGFDDSDWLNSIIANDSLGNLVLESDHAVKIMEEFKPQRIFKSETGRTVYDFGQNASGIISLKVRGNKGAKITIRPDELVNEKGNITQQSGHGPYEFNYILKGEGAEEWKPRFTYYGFRYADVEIVEPEDAEVKTEILELKMLHTRNSSPAVGSFRCSDTLFNKIFDLINWSIKSNMASISTDCPHREKLGWLEQTQLMGPSIHFNFDIHSLYDKIVTDMMDSQLENGLVPDIAPEYVPFKEGFRDSPEWGSASVIVPWQIYKWYGDKEVLTRAYPMMKRYIEYLQLKAQNHILDYGLGDWCDLGPNPPGEAQLTPKAVTATSIYFYDLSIISETAKILGFEDDSRRYGLVSEKVKTEFLKNYYNPKTGVCATGSQTSYAMPLYLGIIPTEDKELVLNNLIESIRKNNYTLTSGDIGYHFLVRVLDESGHSDILYQMNSDVDRPGYGYQIKNGATALTESWTALTNLSNNHLMLGHLMEWFYTGLGGINQTDSSIAYRDIIISPDVVGNISWVKCSYNSSKGIISSEWKVSSNSFTLHIDIPSGAQAKVVIPKGYMNLPSLVNDRTKNAVLDIKIKNGSLNMPPGKYIIKMVNKP